MKKKKRMGAVLILVCLLLCLAALLYIRQNRTISKESDVEENAENIGNEESDSKIETNITVEDSQVTTCRQIDANLSAELESGNYTFDNPLVVVNPYQNSPLTALVLFNTKKNVSVKATVKGDEVELDYSGETDAGTAHKVPVLGLYAGRTNQVLLEMYDEDGNKTKEQTIEITTDPLPESMENLVEIYESGEDTAMPFILVTGQSTYHSFVFDKAGEVRWYLSENSGSYGIFPISGGRFMFQDRETMIATYEKPHTTKMYEMDYLGRTHKVYYLENGWHHEVIEKEEGGNLLVLSSSIDEHVEDTVVEIDRQTGEVVQELDLREIFGDTYVDMIDWAHLNTIDYNAEENTVILSPRNLHSVIKVDWETKELIWILANPEFWEGTDFEDKVLEPVGDIVWHYQQHASYQIPDTDDDENTIQLMLFDNHWDKTRDVDFFDGYEKSYVTQYTIDEENMTVSQDHLYGGVKSKITSNFVLDLDANRVFSMGGYLDPEIDGNNGMIYEFTYDTEEVVNQYALANTFYRAYNFAPDYASLEEDMEQDTRYNFGSLEGFTKLEETIETPEQEISDSLEMKIIDGVIYIKAKDHDVTKIFLKGSENCYEIDFSETLPGEDLYENVSYYVTAPLRSLKADTYDLILEYQEEMVTTEKQVTIKE
ncbi:MAG: aryl-sulfate sulfotransferase [Lachnospiraceae bacterium]|nr:aryl-sulfate sulfotransferase [Lachnospiraceae bacterium]